MEEESADLTPFEHDMLVQMKSHEPDWALRYFVALADNGVSVGMTLTVGGILIAGQIIGGREYLRLLGASMAEGLGRTQQEAEKLFDEWADKYYPQEEGAERPVRTFIHMKDAKFSNISALSPAQGPGVLWRGQLAHVSGFHLGVLTLGRA